METSKDIDINNIFGIGSITKVFVAVVIFQLIEERKLTLSTRLGDILPPDILDGIANAADATMISCSTIHLVWKAGKMIQYG